MGMAEVEMCTHMVQVVVIYRYMVVEGIGIHLEEVVKGMVVVEMVMVVV